MRSKQEIYAYIQAWRKRNRERCREYAIKSWRKNKDKWKQKATQWRKSLRGKSVRREYEKARREKDPTFKVLSNTRHRIWRALRRGDKPLKTIELLGCTPNQYRQKLETQFKPGWGWNNYGIVWEIDHKRPCVTFNLRDPQQLKECFHFSNVRPLEISKNRSRKKGGLYRYCS
jgi:hypothetical protein